MYNFYDFILEKTYDYKASSKLYLNKSKYVIGNNIENIDPRNIKVVCAQYGTGKTYYFEFPQFNKVKNRNDYYFWTNEENYIIYDFHKYCWKFILAIIYKYEEWECGTLGFETYYDHIDIRDQLNNILQNIKGYYVVYLIRKNKSKTLIFTKDKNYYDAVIKNSGQIIYKNEDPNDIKLYTNVRDQEIEFLRNIKIEDMYLDSNLYLHFRDQNIDNIFMKLNVNRFRFVKGKKENPFDRYIGHRFHVKYGHGLSYNLRGIGLGLKLYKMLISTVGYIVSNNKVSDNARNLYQKLLKDGNYTKVVDMKNDRLIIIDKKYVHYQRVLTMIKNFEKNNNLKFIYDYYN